MAFIPHPQFLYFRHHTSSSVWFITRAKNFGVDISGVVCAIITPLSHHGYRAMTETDMFSHILTILAITTPSELVLESVLASHHHHN